MSYDKNAVMGALYTFVAKRPGLDPRDYGGGIDGWRAYSQESRAVTKDRHNAETLLGAVSRISTITGDDIVNAAKGAFSGRLEIAQNDKGEIVIDYCVGQYWPTEYRKAVSAIMRSLLWAYWRDHCACDSFDKIKAAARREFRSRAIVQSFY